ncbi:unnamed protein product [Larinioides sclopetarius]|uniref:Uncharacterized protein n=1 Tax=Larinioides sclopetarius TaxID=280406 RepID=A0AAV2A9E1_9ARAC
MCKNDSNSNRKKALLRHRKPFYANQFIPYAWRSIVFSYSCAMIRVDNIPAAYNGYQLERWWLNFSTRMIILQLLIYESFARRKD